MWVGVRLDYFLGRKGNYKDRENSSFCLKLFAASTVEGLTEARPFTFGHDLSSPECAVDINVCEVSKDFPPAFIPNEPALQVSSGRLYLVFVVMTFQGKIPSFNDSFIAVFSTRPKGDISTWTWQYHGKLAEHPEAKELGGDALTQIELANSPDGKLLAFLTPESWDTQRFRASRSRDVFYGIHHYGCAVVEVASLNKPALARRTNGKLMQRAWLFCSDIKLNPGAPGYDPASATGILYTLRDIQQPDELAWSLHVTGFHPSVNK
jgi:hypothetical protein